MTDIRVEALEEPIAAKLREECRSDTYPAASVRVFPSGCAHTDCYQKSAERFRDFEIREDDVWVASYPKCGTTWTQEMVWLIANNLDFEKAKAERLTERVPFFDFPAIVSKSIPGIPEDILQFFSEMKTKRIFKTHLTKDLLPLQIWTKKPKVIYVARDPKDVVVSYYHHHRLWNGYTGTFEDFFEGFLADVLVYSPFWDHVLDYWKLRDEPHILFNTYEEMKRDLHGVIRKTADFLGKSLNEEQVNQLAEHLSFRSMKSNPATNLEIFAELERKRHGLPEQPDLKFIRQGECGGWRKEMTQEMADKLDAWTKQRLEGTGYNLSSFNKISDVKGHTVGQVVMDHFQTEASTLPQRI
ncbi:luciferin sulfotransferase-like [Periplaneta americana]|uniref:luciferin sulfotransferase-like n=1 Tax=Periplaneta americana TaxID=6978 RepID=UPI0037E79D9A